MLIAQGAIDAMKIGLTIAIRYSADRPQVRVEWRCLPCAGTSLASMAQLVLRPG